MTTDTSTAGPWQVMEDDSGVHVIRVGGGYGYEDEYYLRRVDTRVQGQAIVDEENAHERDNPEGTP